MHYGAVPGLERPVSRVVQGCMMLREAERDAGFAVLDAAWESGVNAFDHAHGYGGGECDRVFGAWLRSRGNRDEVVILAKGCHPHGAGKRVTPAAMAADIEDSRARMGVDVLDLWLFHRDDPEVPVGPLVEEANRQLAAGRIRAYGGSNWSTARLAAARTYAVERGLTPMSVSSPHFSLAEQIDSPWGDDCVTLTGAARAADRDWYRREGLPVFAWSSLARGFLSGRLTRANFEAVRGDFEEHAIRCYACEANWRRLERAERLAADKGLTVPQVALAWVLAADFPVFALIGARGRAECAANAAAVACELGTAERDWLERGDRQTAGA